MQTFEQTFTGAATWKLAVPGAYFTVLGCSNAVNVRLYKGGQLLNLGEVKGLLAGLEILPKIDPGLDYAFDYVEVDASAADTIKIGIGNGEARYNRSQGNVAITNVNNALVSAQRTVTNVSAVMIAANANRRYLLIQNKDSVGNLFVAFGVVATSANGVRIAPGASLTIDAFCVNNSINVIGDIASNANVVSVEG